MQKNADQNQLSGLFKVFSALIRVPFSLYTVENVLITLRTLVPAAEFGSLGFAVIRTPPNYGGTLITRISRNLMDKRNPPTALYSPLPRKHPYDFFQLGFEPGNSPDG